MDDDAAAAIGWFDQALAASPNSAEANYGMGYAQRMAGNDGAATTYLCKAIRLGDTELQREVQGVMDAFKLTCP